ncbi:sulfite exporter TauE/SafE family protein [Demequina sp.]|uniref:sulfite exporter TauE/SafE family protein n=1 Tax=Demequina sp. TaxID=2050685 RepID=UPI0025C57AF1|nr:sulfite exporter TauE/SafE family protein [Demequina sp.]
MPHAPRWAPRWLLLLIVGILGGLLSGVFGVGGGAVMVPLLIWLLGMDQRRAAATSLVAIVPTAIVGSVAYGFGGHVAIIVGGLVAVGGIGGALIGTRLLRRVPIGVLRWMFVGLLGLAAVETLIDIPSRDAEISLTMVSGTILLLVGVLMGVASGLFGIGGGVIVVPILMGGFGASDLLAKGTSLAAMIPAAITGSAANMRARLVRVGDGLVVGFAASAASLLGVVVAYHINPRVSGLLFSVLLTVTMVQLAYRAIKLRGVAD